MQQRIRHMTLALPVAGEATVVLAIQFIPMAMLPVGDYAWYAGIYLIYAAFLAIMFATIADVWAREARRGSTPPEERKAYYATLTLMACSSAILLGAPLALIGGQVVVGLLGGTAAGLALFRAGSRYYLITTRAIGRTSRADLWAGAFGTVLTVATWNIAHYTTTTALAIWAVVSLTSIIISRARPEWSPQSARVWFRAKQQTIRTLLGDAGITNLASIGTPYLAGAMLGPTGLALVRAATSFAYPTRLILGALRSRIIAGQIPRTTRVIAVVWIAGGSIGVILASALMLADSIGLASESAFGLVAGHAVAVGALVAATTASTFLQFLARGELEPGSLIWLRLFHTIIILLSTATGAALGADDGVLWGAVGGSLLATGAWLLAITGGRARSVNDRLSGDA